MKLLLAILSILSGLFLACSESGLYTKARILQTSRDGDKLTVIHEASLKNDEASTESFIKINPEQTYQTILGFGGAFTESSAHVLNQLSPEKRQEVIDAYFSSGGAHYSLTRTHINSCDFSLTSYSYASNPGDTLLESFTIKDDEEDLIPLIKDAMAAKDASFKILASPWTAPPWMKDNNDWNGGSLIKEYYPTWSLFFSKYIQAYEKEGIPIWAVTVENEPLGNGGNWESMHFTPSEMTDFVKHHLGPQFKTDNINSHILIYDQNRDHLEEWATEILGDSAAASYIWGTAIHWYSSTNEWYPETLEKIHKSFPEKPLLHTEACIDAEVPHWQDDDWYWKKEATDWGWDWAAEEDKHLHPKYVPVYRYARDIIGCLNSWVTGWIDWNIVLDTYGGPNHVHNWCIAPVIADPKTNEVYYTPLYYVMRHFSKYIRPGAQRVGIETDLDELMVVACKNIDDNLILQIFNPTENAIPYSIQFDNKSVSAKISGSAIQTIIIE